ncbi:MAG TPA: hypothetical protein DCZ11_03215 [Gammaproteobacteria bacterium]|nr:hypothetical protein [Gammaproteobacteria bacterium]MCH77436.1 hypothetical protein [Gammaproteobacteria bacterium]
MSTLAAVTALNDTLSVATALSGIIKAAQEAGREVTQEELDAARNAAIAAASEARAAADKS